VNKRLTAVLCLVLMLVGCAAPAPSSSSEPSSQPEVQAPKEPRFTDSIKILAIGNSYTQNAITYLHPILTDLGVEEVVVANLFIGGCDLTAHFDNTKNDAALYDYYKTAADGTLMKENVKYSIKQGLEDEDWDIIVLNQASAKAGQDMTYTKLDDLIVYVNEHKTNPDAELWWHMTWAYHPRNPHTGFAYYDNDQQKMYGKIVDTVQSMVVPMSEIAGVIPGGTAYQNARASAGNAFSDTDLHHANADGCYLLGLTWAAALTNMDVTQITYAPKDVLTADVCRRAAAHAAITPFSVTE
jgi:hypothetical protein